MDIAHFKSEVKSFYSTFAAYAEIWKTKLDKFDVFSWMLIKVQPEWMEVEVLLNYLNQNTNTIKIEVNDSNLFNQISNIRKIVTKEIEESADDWKKLSSSERSKIVLSKMDKDYSEQYVNIFKICQFLFAIPGHNENVERIFSLMEIQWTDERNSLQTSTVEAILQCLVNFDMGCSDMYQYLLKTPKLLKAVKSNEKYVYKYLK